MNERFNVHICVTSSAKLATIMSVLDGEAKLISVEHIEEKSKKGNGSRYLNGKKNKGISALDLILQTLKGGKATSRAELDKAFAKVGFSPNSVRPSLSKAVADKYVKEVEGNKFVILPKAQG